MTLESSWFLYIIETEKGSLYTGITTDVERRWSEHLATAKSAKGLAATSAKSKKGAKFFRSQMPKKVVYTETFGSRSEASKREAEIKQFSKKEKLELIQ